MKKKTIGFAMCGSFCTFEKAIPVVKQLCEQGYDIIPIMSESAYSTDTRFGDAKDFIDKLEEITKNKVISSLTSAEPIGPKKLLDAMIIEPCTGNTLAKLAIGIADSTVTLAAKSHLRNSRPLILAVSTNDGLGGAAKNIGNLINYKNLYFIPMTQDDFNNKPKSIVADFNQTSKTLELALKGSQIQPIYF